MGMVNFPRELIQKACGIIYSLREFPYENGFLGDNKGLLTRGKGRFTYISKQEPSDDQSARSPYENIKGGIPKGAYWGNSFPRKQFPQNDVFIGIIFHYNDDFLGETLPLESLGRHELI